MNTSTIRFKAKQGISSLKYLRHWLNSISFRQQVSQLVTGSAQLNFGPSHLQAISILLPSFTEQERLAAVLDKAEAIGQKRREALAHLDRLQQAVFVEMFGDPVTNPKGWPVNSLGTSLSFLTSGSRGWAAYYADSGKTFLRIQNVGRGRLNLDDLTYVDAPDSAEARRTRVQPGDVLFSITADLGRSAVVPNWMDEAYINQHLAILRSPNTNPVYLSAYLSSPAGQRQVQGLNKGGVKAGLNFDDIRSIQILFPPLELQNRYAFIVEQVEGLRTREQVFTSDVNALFISLQSRAFAGEL